MSLTIDLGFASTALPSGRIVAIIDVPGHVRFLKNMLAGVGAVELLDLDRELGLHARGVLGQVRVGLLQVGDYVGLILNAH